MSVFLFYHLSANKILCLLCTMKYSYILRQNALRGRLRNFERSIAKSSVTIRDYTQNVYMISSKTVAISYSGKSFARTHTHAHTHTHTHTHTPQTSC